MPRLMVSGSFLIFFLYEKKTNQKKHTPAAHSIGFVRSSRILGVAKTGSCLIVAQLGVLPNCPLKSDFHSPLRKGLQERNFVAKYVQYF
jgi:hypothetical protein